MFIFSDAPSLDISFRYNGIQQKMNVRLPLTVNKFFEPTEMNSESFFARWKNLGGYVILSVIDDKMINHIKDTNMI